jgi:ATP-dependent DNA ligase
MVWQEARTGAAVAHLVLDVSADHVAGGRMRHGSRFMRWRPDKKPSQCKLEQVER